MKKIIYNLLKYPLIFIFIKTPFFFKILKKRFKNQLLIKKKNIIWNALDVLFQKEYYSKLENIEEINILNKSVLIDGTGKKWAEYYYNKHFQTLDELKNSTQGIMSYNDANPVFEKMINFIRSNNFSEDENTYIIQLGSSSGRDLEFFSKIFPNVNYISTDINLEILNFQKEKYNQSNFNYFQCFAEDFDKCINYFNISTKNIILFSIGSLQYLHPINLERFFSKLKNFNKLNLFINDAIKLTILDNKKKLISEHRGGIAFSHLYDDYANNFGINIIERKVIRPYSKNDKLQYNTGIYYLHAQNYLK